LKDLTVYRNRENEVYKNLESVNKVMQVLEDARFTGRHIFICGNDGSEVTAIHYCCDFNKGVSKNKDQKNNFECLSDNVPTMMAVANSIGYEEVFRFLLMILQIAEDLHIVLDHMMYILSH